MSSPPANPFVPERQVAAADCQPCWQDWSLRAGASFDLFGTGKTALKASVGKFLAANALGTTSSLNPLGGQSDTRTWTDRDLNGTVIGADGSIQINEIGPPRNNAFGTPAGSLKIDPDLKRGNNWEEAISVQHEAAPEHVGDRRLLSPAVLQHRRGAESRGRSGSRLHAVHRRRADARRTCRTAAARSSRSTT